MAKPAPTAEQQEIITAATTGGSLVVEAGAGTGKTSTLRMIAEALAPKRGLYLAYNKAIQVEADSKFPANVTCKTAHSLAFRQFGKPRMPRIQGQRTSARYAAGILGIERYKGADETYSPKQIAIIVRNALTAFCNSDADVPQWRHIEAPESLSGDEAVAFRRHVMPYVVAAWNDLVREDGRLNQPYMQHDSYLKMWSLSKPDLSVDFVLFDEAQDANPCIAAVVEAQACQTIMVGDRAQAIYGWRGAVDAMTNFAADHRLMLTQSFRFGVAVAEQANRWLVHTGAPLRLSGFGGIDSKVDSLAQPDAILCRTNAGVIAAAMAEQSARRRVSITGGTAQIESFVKAAQKLMEGGEVEHPELGIYRSWDEVLEAVENGEAQDIGPMIRLIDKYSSDAILSVCRYSTTPDKADVIVSTAHKAKGLEWDSVRIHSDFLPPKEETGQISRTEAMLIYVAVTRAKLVLDNSALAWLDDFEAEAAA